jgi:hypothetical protein
VPVLALSGAILAMSIAAVRTTLDSRSPGPPLASMLLLLVVVFIAAIQTVRHQQRVTAERDAQLEVVSRAAGFGPAAMVFHYRASSPAYALHFANSWAGFLYSTQLAEMYPSAAYLNIWTMEVEAYRTPEPVLSSDGTPSLLLQGTPFTAEQLAELPFPSRPVLLFTNGLEAVYRLQ